MIDLEGLEKLRAEATEAGDWSADENTIWSNARGVPVADACIGTPVWYRGPKLPYQANAALIVAAVNALPELVERVKRLEGALKAIAKEQSATTATEAADRMQFIARAALRALKETEP